MFTGQLRIHVVVQKGPLWIHLFEEDSLDNNKAFNCSLLLLSYHLYCGVCLLF